MLVDAPPRHEPHLDGTATYDVHRDLAQLDARMQKTAAFAATLLGENLDEAESRARSNRIRCRLDDQDTIIDSQVG
jgi:hypothetical protein